MYPWGSNHRFVEIQQEQYDSLAAKGRRLYDRLRWDHGLNHEDAFNLALDTCGQSRYYLEYKVPEQGYNVLDETE